ADLRGGWSKGSPLASARRRRRSQSNWAARCDAGLGLGASSAAIRHRPSEQSLRLLLSAEGSDEHDVEAHRDWGPLPDCRASRGELRSCTVSYQDLDGVTQSVEATAGTLDEATILGMQAMKVPRWRDRPSLKIEIRVKQPETTPILWNSTLSAWLAR